MSDQLRNIASIEVKLPGTVNVQEHHPYCHKDYYTRLLRQPEVWTTSLSKYFASVASGSPLVPESEWAGAVERKWEVPKYWVSPRCRRGQTWGFDPETTISLWDLFGEVDVTDPNDTAAWRNILPEDGLPSLVPLGNYVILRPSALRVSTIFAPGSAQAAEATRLAAPHIWHLGIPSAALWWYTSWLGIAQENGCFPKGSPSVVDSCFLTENCQPLAFWLRGYGGDKGNAIALASETGGTGGNAAHEDRHTRGHNLIKIGLGADYLFALDVTAGTLDLFAADEVTGTTWVLIDSQTHASFKLPEDTTIFLYPIGSHFYVFTEAQIGTGEVAADFVLDAPVYYGRVGLRIETYMPEGWSWDMRYVVHEPVGMCISPATLFPTELATTTIVSRATYEHGAGNDAEGEHITFPRPSDPDKERWGFLDSLPCGSPEIVVETCQTGAGNSALLLQTRLLAGQQDMIRQTYTALEDVDAVGITEAEVRARYWRNTSRLLPYMYSPALSNSTYTVEFPIRQILLGQDLLLTQVKTCTVSRNHDSSSASVTCNNRQGWMENRPPGPGGQSTNTRLMGVKPIQITAWYVGEESERHKVPLFTGFITGRKFNRAVSPESSMTLTCADNLLRLETMTFALPVFDGGCHLSIVYYMARYAGFGDDEILYYQDPWTGSKVTIRQVMEAAKSNMDTRRGGCWDGHVLGFPDSVGFWGPGPQGMDGRIVHHCMPYSADRMQPNFKPAKGATCMDVLKHVVQETQWLLYANNWGNLVYQPIDVAIAQNEQGLRFDETPMQVNDFTEILQSISMDYPMADVRNSLTSYSLVQLGRDADGNPKYVPIVQKSVEEGWPNNTESPTFIPWQRQAVVVSPFWNDKARFAAVHNQRFRRLDRIRVTTSFSAWGSPLIVPVQRMWVNEYPTYELGQVQTPGDISKCFVISSVSHSFDNQFQWHVGIEAELIDETIAFNPDETAIAGTSGTTVNIVAYEDGT